MKHPKGPGAIFLGLVLLSASCASARIERKLDPKSRDFISKVRYIITPEERKAFHALPEADREAFIEDFWKRRDTNPKTEENEFKKEYFERIDQANRLFSGGGSPGWLQDRGRIYITLGPPDHRETYPRGVTFYGVPTEYWWYGFFVITFIDDRWVDDYRLDPASVTQIAMINRAQVEWNQPGKGFREGAGTGRAQVMPGLDVKIEKIDGEATRFTLVIPYRNIWLKSRGRKFEATLEATLKVLDAAGAEAWTFSRSFPIEIPQDRLNEVLKDNFTAETVATLKPGAYTLKVVIINATDKSQASFERAFEI
jgi:GWxTD domain-containing protein